MEQCRPWTQGVASGTSASAPNHALDSCPSTRAPPTQRRGSTRAPICWGTVIQGGSPVAEARLRGAGPQTQLFPSFSNEVNSRDNYAGLTPAHYICWRKRNRRASPKSASRPRTGLQSGSVAHYGEEDGAVPQKIPSQKLLSSKRRGRRQEIPPPRPGARGQALTVSASFSLLPGTPEGLPSQLQRQGKLSVPNCTEVNQPVTKQTQRRTPGVTRGRKRKALCFVACSFTGNYIFVYTQFIRFHT